MVLVLVLVMVNLEIGYLDFLDFGISIFVVGIYKNRVVFVVGRYKNRVGYTGANHYF